MPTMVMLPFAQYMHEPRTPGAVLHPSSLGLQERWNRCCRCSQSRSNKLMLGCLKQWNMGYLVLGHNFPDIFPKDDPLDPPPIHGRTNVEYLPTPLDCPRFLPFLKPGVVRGGQVWLRKFISFSPLSLSLLSLLSLLSPLSLSSFSPPSPPPPPLSLSPLSPLSLSSICVSGRSIMPATVHVHNIGR